MTAREWKRLDIVQRVERGALTAVEASQVLGISTRQLRRLRRQVRRRGTEGGGPWQHGTTTVQSA